MLLARKLLMLALFVPAVAALAGGDVPRGEAPKPEAAFSPRLLDANPLIGAKVVNDRGEGLGTIEDVVLNEGRDRVSYVALGSGGFLGIGQKYYAVPWNALKIESPKRGRIDKVLLNLSRKDLESAESFDDLDNCPEHGNRDLNPQEMAREGMLLKHERPVPEMAEEWAMSAGNEPLARSIRFRRLTEIIGLETRNLQGEPLGDIDNLVLDLREGRPVYAVLGFGGFLGLGQKEAVVPWSAVEVLPRLATARIDAGKDLLAAIAYEQGNAPNLTDLAEAEKIYQRFQEEPYWQVFGYVETTGKTARPLSVDAWRPGSMYNALFDAETIVDKSGTIASVGTFVPAENAAPGLRLRLATDDGKITTVHAGPRDFAASKGLVLHYGDKIRVTGSLTEVNGRMVIIASTIVHGDKTLVLRDKTGLPLWESKEIK